MKITFIIIGTMQILNAILGQYFGNWGLLKVIGTIMIGTGLIFFGDLK